MATDEHRNTLPTRTHECAIYKVVYHPPDPGENHDIERRLNEAFDVLFAIASAIDG